MPTSDQALPVDRLHRIGVVVKDVERAATRYAEIFGIDHWDVRAIDTAAGDQVEIDGRSVPAALRTVTGTLPSGVVAFELVDAGRGETTYQYLRCIRGQGVHHLTIRVGSRSQVDELTAELAKRGAGVAQRIRSRHGHETVQFDTQRLLGGYHLQAVVEPSDAAGSTAAVDEVWDLSTSYERPGGRDPLDVQQLHHLGIVVRDVVPTVERYADTFGITTWPFMNWRTEYGRLDAPFYRGEPVDHGYFCGMGFGYRNFGFELIQPTHGRSHYKEDFLDLVGEGVHHMQLVYPEDEDEWAGIVDWMGGLDIPVVMGSQLRGGATTFYYLNTQEALGGWSIETTIRHAGADPSKRIYDFTREFPDAPRDPFAS